MTLASKFEASHCKAARPQEKKCGEMADSLDEFEEIIANQAEVPSTSSEDSTDKEESLDEDDV